MDSSELLAALAKRYAELGHWVEVDSRWLDRWTAAVVIGVAVELWIIWKEYSTDLREFKRGTIRSPERPHTVKYLVGALSGVLVLAGILGEFFITRHTSEKETEMRSISGRETAIAETDAGNANLEAARVRESVAPRRLSKEQREIIAHDLAQFKGQPVAAINSPLDVEGAVFAAEILQSLEDSKWDTNPILGVGGTASSKERAPYIPVTGVLIESTLDKKSKAAAEAFRDALTASGFDARIPEKGPLGGFDTRKEPLVVVDVEARPEGPQGEAKLRAQKRAK